MAKVTEELVVLGKSLNVGDSIYTSHQDCTSSDKLWLYRSDSGVGFYCNKCGEKGYKGTGLRRLREVHREDSNEERVMAKLELPKDIVYDTSKWDKAALMWLYSSDVRNDDIKAYKLGYSPKLHRVVIPVYSEEGVLICWQGRGLTSKQTKYYNVRGYGKKYARYCSWVKPGDMHYDLGDRSEVVVVEDALSVIRVGKVRPCVALLGTSANTSVVMWLSGFSKVLVWLDDDAGGWNGSIKLLRKLAMLTEYVRIRTTEDPKKLSNAQIAEVLQHDRQNTSPSG